MNANKFRSIAAESPAHCTKFILIPGLSEIRLVNVKETTHTIEDIPEIKLLTTVNKTIATDIKAMRQVQVSSAWRTMVFKAKGKKCAVCGKEDLLEIHHVLPISMLSLIHI